MSEDKTKVQLRDPVDRRGWHICYLLLKFPTKKRRKLLPHHFFFANVRLLCLGGPANLFPFLGVQTWEGLENLIKMQR